MGRVYFTLNNGRNATRKIPEFFAVQKESVRAYRIIERHRVSEERYYFIISRWKLAARTHRPRFIRQEVCKTTVHRRNEPTRKRGSERERERERLDRAIKIIRARRYLK